MFLTRPQVLLLLVVWGPHFEKPCFSTMPSQKMLSVCPSLQDKDFLVLYVLYSKQFSLTPPPKYRRRKREVFIFCSFNCIVLKLRQIFQTQLVSYSLALGREVSSQKGGMRVANAICNGRVDGVGLRVKDLSFGPSTALWPWEDRFSFHSIHSPTCECSRIKPSLKGPMRVREPWWVTLQNTVWITVPAKPTGAVLVSAGRTSTSSRPWTAGTWSCIRPGGRAETTPPSTTSSWTMSSYASHRSVRMSSDSSKRWASRPPDLPGFLPQAGHGNSVLFRVGCGLGIWDQGGSCVEDVRGWGLDLAS